jgi:hypothetical protein
MVTIIGNLFHKRININIYIIKKYFNLSKNWTAKGACSLDLTKKFVKMGSFQNAYIRIKITNFGNEVYLTNLIV